MRQRIWALTRYFWRTVQFSLTGLIYVILALAYWWILFNPQQGTPNAPYYVLVTAVFGAAASFLLTLSFAARGNQAEHYPFVVRFPSRVEYLTAVMLASFVMAGSLQLLVALLALYRGPAINVGLFLDAVPVWTAVNILAAVLALHASDFVALGWSRVIVFSFIALLLIVQDNNNPNSGLISTFTELGQQLTMNGSTVMGSLLSQIAQFLSGSLASQLREFLGFFLWPFSAITNATINGYFSPAQAMAPAVLLLYATVLFLLAADLFATKDLDFLE